MTWGIRYQLLIAAGLGADGGEEEMLFGGNTLLSTNGQTWTYSPNNWTERSPSPSPSARAWGSRIRLTNGATPPRERLLRPVPAVVGAPDRHTDRAA